MKNLIILMGIFSVFYKCETKSAPYSSIEEYLQIPTDFNIETSCLNDVEFTNQDVKYYLYTRENFALPIKLTLANLKELDPNKPTKVIITGWLGRATDEIIRKVVFAYLNRYDCNVISIDYLKFVLTTFSRSVCNVRRAAKFIGNFFCKAQVRVNLDLDKVHFIGLSLGGQLIGLVGQNTYQICNTKVGRLTALDPAGPIYQHLKTNERLDKSDGKFVDVIHTDMGFFGYFGACGHIDFFPNCGIYQPGCGLFFTIPCSHVRSLYYFTESIAEKFPAFNSTSCSNCFTNTSSTECEADEINPKYAIMGEDCTKSTTATKFVLETDKRYPYAKG